MGVTQTTTNHNHETAEQANPIQTSPSLLPVPPVIELTVVY